MRGVGAVYPSSIESKSRVDAFNEEIKTSMLQWIAPYLCQPRWSQLYNASDETSKAMSAATYCEWIIATRLIELLSISSNHMLTLVYSKVSES